MGLIYNGCAGDKAEVWRVLCAAGRSVMGLISDGLRVVSSDLPRSVLVCLCYGVRWVRSWGRVSLWGAKSNFSVCSVVESSLLHTVHGRLFTVVLKGKGFNQCLRSVMTQEAEKQTFIQISKTEVDKFVKAIKRSVVERFQ